MGGGNANEGGIFFGTRAFGQEQPLQCMTCEL